MRRSEHQAMNARVQCDNVCVDPFPDSITLFDDNDGREGSVDMTIPTAKKVIATMLSIIADLEKGDGQ